MFRNTKSKLLLMPNMAALAAIMVALLAMFMVDAGTPRPDRRVNTYVPSVAHPKPMPAADDSDALNVSVTKDGSVYFGRDRVTLVGLSYEIRARMKDQRDMKVYISADRRAKYGDVKEVLDTLRAAGVENIAFLTETHQNPSEAPKGSYF